MIVVVRGLGLARVVWQVVGGKFLATNWAMQEANLLKVKRRLRLLVARPHLIHQANPKEMTTM